MVCNTIYSGSNPLDTSKKLFVLINKQFFLYLPILKTDMFSIKNSVLILFVLLSFISNAQVGCALIPDSTKITNIACFGDNTGSINVTLLQPDNIYQKSYWWTGPNGFTANQILSLSNLVAGDYVLTIIANLVEGDTSEGIWCSNLQGDTLGGAPLDTITVRETIEITASFVLSNMCNANDSADVVTTIFGGTPPYTTLWSTGDTSRNTTNLAQNSGSPYTLTITDKNNCANDQYLIVTPTLAMIPFMSSTGVICKDDNSGSARVFVTQGTSPFQFQWSTVPPVTENGLESTIDGLYPGEYAVMIIDDMGCITQATIDVKSDPSICLTIYKAFSPNDDAVHEFWEIENINLYPEALVLVYDRNGSQVYRRRNYENAEGQAFGGKDQQGRELPSGTYYYVIDLENGDKISQGTVTIVR